MNGSKDISVLPFFSFFDVFSYLMVHQGSFTSVREYKKSEGYCLMIDGFVKNIEIVVYDNIVGYWAIKGFVRPRTRDKDPVSGASHYCPWIILTTVGADKRSCVVSAFCTCKGGIDGCCRHILATLYEVINFRDDAERASVTSGPCLWVRRATEHQNAVLLTEIVTSCSNEKVLQPIPGQYQPVPDDIVMTPVEDFLADLKETLPGACMFFAWEIQSKTPPFSTPVLTVKPPLECLHHFLEMHVCTDEACDCAQQYLSMLKYSSEEYESIEKSTRGQHLNKNWHIMRTGFITASVVKKVLSSTNFEKTAKALLKDNSFDNDKLPAAIRFGREREKTALNLFSRSHKYKHRNCKLLQPGLFVSKSLPFLGASPDAIFECSHHTCGKFLVEVKCLYSLRNTHPKHTMKLCDFCEQAENGEFHLKKRHDYYCQTQCQMAVTGIHKCVLCVYTKKGIETIDVAFDQEFWDCTSVKLELFWKKYLFPLLVMKVKNENCLQKSQLCDN